MAGGVRDIDKGWKRVKTELRRMDKAYVKIGLLQNAGRSGKTSLAMIGFWNEFGTRNIPARSFIRSTEAEKRSTYTLVARREADKIIRGQSSVFRSLSLMGQLAESHVKKKITVIRRPRNAASTIAKKGFDNPLIHTGRMRASVRYVVKGAR